jgi:hypothetical protein
MAAQGRDPESLSFCSAHVESTVNQLINWRFCKKQQMSWTRAGARKACSTSKLLHSMANYTNTPDTLSPGPLPRSPHLFYGPHLAGYELQPIASFPEQ